MAENKRATVNVASKIMTPIRLGADYADGRVVTLAGSPQGELGDEVITKGVDKETFDRWVAEHEGSPMVKRVRIVSDTNATEKDDRSSKVIKTIQPDGKVEGEPARPMETTPTKTLIKK